MRACGMFSNRFVMTVLTAAALAVGCGEAPTRPTPASPAADLAGAPGVGADRGALDRADAGRAHGARLGVSSPSSQPGSHRLSSAQPVLSESHRARRSAAADVHAARVSEHRGLHRHGDRHPRRSLSGADLRPDGRAVHLPSAHRVLRMPPPRGSVRPTSACRASSARRRNPLAADRSSGRGRRSAVHRATRRTGCRSDRFRYGERSAGQRRRDRGGRRGHA